MVDTNCTFDDGRIIRIQGANLPYDTPVYEEQGEVMVPLRAIIEALGGSVAWDEATRTVAISCRGVEARVEVDSQKVLVGGGEKWPQATPQLRYDRTYIPFSYLENVLGLQQPWTTGWEEDGQLIELLYASEEQAADIPSTSTVTPAHE